MNTQHDITVSGKPLNPPKPPAKPHMLLWIDTETTGLDPNQCELLEVGMQVTDLKAETRGDSLHLIVHPDAEAHTWAKLRQGFPYSALACLDRLIEHERNQQ